MEIMSIEVEEKALPASENPDESSKKGKILTLLFPPEFQSVDGKEVKKDKNKPPTKVVIRRLPPKLTKEAFLEEFSPLPAHDYFHFVRGDLNLGTHAFSRAYINFLNQDDIYSFKEKFDDFDIQDEKGKMYHSVVEFAPFQKVPRRNVIKKKLSKAGTLESDPKYIEFLHKLEESKNFINNPSEYFHETESSALKTKVVTTPLLEYLKKKKQKKNDPRNEIRQRKREAEKEKRKRDEDKRKAERERRKEEKKNLEKNKASDEKGKKIELKDRKTDECGWQTLEKKESKSRFFVDFLENEPAREEQSDPVIPNDPAILEVVVRQSSTEKDLKSGIKTAGNISEETKSLENNESETNVGKPERKYSDFRNRFIEEKQRKTFFKRDVEESKMVKSSQGNRKGVPDEKGDNYNIGNCSESRDSGRKIPLDADTKRHDHKVEVKETKSKFRYSEQRNRDREFRQKTSDCKTPKENQKSCFEIKEKAKNSEDKTVIKVSNLSEEKVKKSSSEQERVNGQKSSSATTDPISLPSRRKSLEMEREVVDTERKRSKSFHDVSSKEFSKFQLDEKVKTPGSSDGAGGSGHSSVPADDNSKESLESEKMSEEFKKERRAERRIRNKVKFWETRSRLLGWRARTRSRQSIDRVSTSKRLEADLEKMLEEKRNNRNNWGANPVERTSRMNPCDCYPTCTYAKDRPSLEIYRPGMGRFSKQRLSERKEDGHVTSAGGTTFPGKSGAVLNKTGKKGNSKNELSDSKPKCEEPTAKNNDENGKALNEVRSMTFTRSAGKEN